jgi:hypothetical protein
VQAGSALSVGAEHSANTSPKSTLSTSIGSSGLPIVPGLPQDSIAILAANGPGTDPSLTPDALQPPGPTTFADPVLNVPIFEDGLAGSPGPIAAPLSPSALDAPTVEGALAGPRGANASTPVAILQDEMAGLPGPIAEALRQFALETGMDLTPDPIFHFAAVPSDFAGTAGRNDFFIYDADAVNSPSTIIGFETGIDELIFMNFDPQADSITLDFALGPDAGSDTSVVVNGGSGGAVTLVNSTLNQATDVVTTPDPMLIL